MTRDDIIRMALEAGFGCDTDGHIFTDNHDGVCDEYLERFAALVAENLLLRQRHCDDNVEYTRVLTQRDQLLRALKAMLRHMGMDEDKWNKPTFDQARAAIKQAEGENT